VYKVDNHLLTTASFSRDPPHKGLAISRRVAALLAIGLVCALYLADLTGMGMVGPDEPRYAYVGRAMAQSGDWVTPRLWGDRGDSISGGDPFLGHSFSDKPWFEKPALLYWMTAAGFRLGLGADLAPRLPVALLSVLFLGFYWWRLSEEWDQRAATFATAMLATSAGWLTYSHVAVTDLPLAAFFSAAVLLSLPWVAGREQHKAEAGLTDPFYGNLSLTAAAACLGLATMAKGLVPLVLFVPVVAIGWRRLRDWFRPGPVLAFSVCALPWYILCTIRNGSEFLRVFFLEQQFGRFRSAALQHVQPAWFYIPLFLVLLYPWFPLLVVLPANLRQDSRVRTLAAIVIFGFVFFSASVNKLPGYLLPLMPATFALLGLGLSRTKRPVIAVIAPVVLLGALPLISGTAPRVLASHGLWSAHIPWMRGALWLITAGIAGGILARCIPKKAFGTATALAALGFLWFQWATFPEFDALASARPLWLAEHPRCAPPLSRDMLYGLYYYSGRQISACPILDRNGTRVVR
jgi:4-amino-4-deoxy-L-arabinose transferase-like glycosyltransferase